MGVVHVAHLETCTVAGQTARTQGGETTLVGHLGQRVDLVHELRQLAGSEERVDDTAEGLRVDQVGRGEHFVVADVHALADGAGYAAQADVELVRELFAYGTDTAVAQVVDVIDVGFGIYKLDEILDDLNDVFFGEDAYVCSGLEAELAVDAVAAHVAQVVAFVGEEELLDHVACSCLIRRFGVTQLTVSVHDGLQFGVALVFLQSVVDDGVI